MANVWKNGAFTGADYYLILDVENSRDHQLFVSASDTSINGIMFSAWGSAYIDEGTTGELKVNLMPAIMQDYGITIVKEIELSFYIT